MIYKGKLWLLDCLLFPFNKKETRNHYEWLKTCSPEDDLFYLLIDADNGDGIVYAIHEDMKIRLY